MRVLKAVGIGCGGLIGLAVLVSVLGALFANSFNVFLISLIVFLALAFVHGRRSGGDQAVQPDQTLGRLGAAAFGIAMICAVLFGGTSLAKNVLGWGQPEQAASPPAATTEETQPPPREDPPEPAAEAPPEEDAVAEAPAPPPPAPEPSPARETERAPAPSAPVGVAAGPDADGDGVAAEAGGAYDGAATVTRVVDGDTIEISPAINGITDVRLIGVDTPETKEPGCAPQPYGAEASAFAESYLSGQEVKLEFDQERTDQYDRLLAYVYLPSGEMFNEMLVKEGYAQAYPYPPNVEHADRFEEAQARAQSAGLGIWALGPDQLALLTDRGNGIGAEGCAPLTPEPEPQYTPPEPQPSPDVPNVPSAPSAPAAGGDLDCKDFSSLAEVQQSIAAGDPHGLDGDDDGAACESQF